MTTSTPLTKEIKTGILFGSCAALIWGAWPVVTSLGVSANLSAFQIVLLRYLIAGPILLPWALKGPHRLKDWLKVAVLSVLAGAPYSFMTASGFQYASATHAGVIIPGTIMLVGLIAAHFMLKDRITRYRALGGAGILLGLWLLAIGAPESGAYPDSLIGDAFFLSGGILWALYTVVLKIWPTDPITIIARITVLSLVGILVALPVLPPISFEGVPTDVLIYQGAWQGFLSSIVALILYNRGVALMGAARAGVTNAIIPVISTILAFVVLSEIPTPIEALGLAAILTGIAIAMFMNSKPKLPIPGAQPTGPQKI